MECWSIRASAVMLAAASMANAQETLPGTRPLLLDGDPEKLARLEESVARHLGFARVLGSVGQVYPRSLDLDVVSEFRRGVYDIARSVGPGDTITYGEIATRLGAPHAAREVGQARGANPIPLIVPW